MTSAFIVLLSPNTSEQGLPEIPQVSVRAKILHGSENFDELLNHLASDLNWTENGIHNKVSQYVLSEPDYNLLGNTLPLRPYFLRPAAIPDLHCIFSSSISAFPILSPACQDLALFGNPKKLLEQAEDELATLPQLATEDMFITEHFFIETSVYGNAHCTDR